MLRQALVFVVLGGLSCSRQPTVGESANNAKEASKPTAAAAASFLCTWDGQQHAIREVGFNWPDAVYALSLSEDERKKLQTGENEDTAVVGEAYFVRGFAPIPIRDRHDDWGIGFWIQISPGDFAEFEKLNRVAHPKYAGRIANQSLYGSPTLGLKAEMEFTREGRRPTIRFTDHRHPLARFQKDGVDEQEWRSWMSEAFHHGDDAPRVDPFQATLDAHGWTVRNPSDLGKAPVSFLKPPGVGDTVKVGIGALVADAKGEITTINAGWWIRLDDVSRPDRWGGTLASHMRVQATLSPGSRVWIRPEQVFEHVAVGTK
ncbi:MAG: hypothetical protein JWO36_1639 [Myxococcales bacterium]|nr:hypothetical protein [Myxococcales bacterium]